MIIHHHYLAMAVDHNQQAQELKITSIKRSRMRDSQVADDAVCLTQFWMIDTINDQTMEEPVSEELWLATQKTDKVLGH